MMEFKSQLKALSLSELEQVQEFLEKEIKERKRKPDKLKHVMMYTDGASRGNPGHSGVGVLLYDNHERKLMQDFRYIGICTNNEAEYRALLLALELAYGITHEKVECFMDSELLVRQLNGQYSLKSEKLAPLFAEVKRRAAQFSSITFTHVPREHPKLRLADKLANRGIDEAKPKQE